MLCSKSGRITSLLQLLLNEASVGGLVPHRGPDALALKLALALLDRSLRHDAHLGRLEALLPAEFVELKELAAQAHHGLAVAGFPSLLVVVNELTLLSVEPLFVTDE